ncbi:MAG: 50S ribosomal protein L17 [Parachlamydiales bacterium]
MRHRNHTAKLGRTGSHKRCLMANMVKSLIEQGRIETSVAKAKEARRYADQMITLAKNDTIANRRHALATLMVRRNALTSRAARQVKEGDTRSCNRDRLVIDKLFGELGPRFAGRQGGYTRIVRTYARRGDHSEQCILEYLSA